MTLEAASEWTQDGSFADRDGAPVRAYDDVILTREIPVEGGVGTTSTTLPAGTIGAVLFFQTGTPPRAQLELYVGAGGFAFGYEEMSHLRFHMSGEEKHGRRSRSEGSVG